MEEEKNKTNCEKGKLTAAAAAVFSGVPTTVAGIVLLSNLMEKMTKPIEEAITNRSWAPVLDNLQTLAPDFGIAAGVYTVGAVAAFKGSEYIAYSMRKNQQPKPQ